MPRPPKREQVWLEMGQLEQLGLGHRVIVSEDRDKFMVNTAHPRVSWPTTQPDADGFIRSDGRSLLFRNASASIRMAIPNLMDTPGMRPFVCDGSPLDAQVFVVGFNPATSMDKPFWHYWSDETGFDKQRFMRDYLEKRGLREPQGVRARTERIVAQLPRGAVVETNICSLPTKAAAALRRDQRTTRLFRFLLEAIKPGIVYAHSNDPIQFFEDLTGQRGFDSGPALQASYRDQEFQLLATRGPLFRMGYANAEALRRNLLVLMQQRLKSGTTITV